MVKRFLIALVLVALVAGGLVGFNMFRDEAISQFFANRPRPAVTVSTAKVEALTWTPRIQAIGTVGAARGVDLTVETTGIVQDVNFGANDRVEEGQVLVVLDNNVQRADLEAARAKAQLDMQVLTRAQELLKRGVGSETAVESAQAAATASASQVAKLEAVLAQKELKAPFSGTIGIPRVEKGQYIAPGNTVATLQDLDTLRADFSVPEQNLPLLKIGLPVRYGLSEDRLDFSGKVTGIEPRVDPQTRLVALRAEITDAGGRLSPGQFVQVRVELPAEGDVLVVPQTALVTSLYGDYLFVVAPAEGKGGASEGEPGLVARQVFVKTGRRAGGVIEVVSGVSAGDEVVTAGQNRLTNNGPVTVDNSVEPLAARSGEAAAQ
ncbi:MAG: efflux RND transporter periplasmic adaptor subunit [Nitratireductor sp.]